VEVPDQLISSWNDRPPPAGFGAIDYHWQPRVGYGGTYGEHWLKTRQPLFAEDLDDRYFQCAPADQQTSRFLCGGEDVSLQNLHPCGPIEFTLPRLRFRFETRFYDGSRELHKHPRLHTVLLEPDHPRVSLVWHSALSCHFKAQKLERTAVTLETRVGAGSSGSEHAEQESS
jgi:hypothetical protein